MHRLPYIEVPTVDPEWPLDITITRISLDTIAKPTAEDIALGYPEDIPEVLNFSLELKVVTSVSEVSGGEVTAGREYVVNPNLVAEYCRSLILDSIPTYAISRLEIRKNTSHLLPEIIALRMGQLPMKRVIDTDDSEFLSPELKELSFKFGPVKELTQITTNMLNDQNSKSPVQFLAGAPLLYLDINEEFIATANIAYEGGQLAPKYRPASSISYDVSKTNNKLFFFEVELIGTIGAEELLEKLVILLKKEFRKSNITLG